MNQIGRVKTTPIVPYSLLSEMIATAAGGRAPPDEDDEGE
jgi:hypothetical protein